MDVHPDGNARIYSGIMFASSSSHRSRVSRLSKLTSRALAAGRRVHLRTSMHGAGGNRVPRRTSPLITLDKEWQAGNARSTTLRTQCHPGTCEPLKRGWAIHDGFPIAGYGARSGLVPRCQVRHFIHWGVYSVPAFSSEWYPRLMYLKGTPENLHHVQTYGPLTKFGYKDFIPMFKAEHFDPAAWAHLFRQVRSEVCGAGLRAP